MISEWLLTWKITDSAPWILPCRIYRETWKPHMKPWNPMICVAQVTAAQGLIDGMAGNFSDHFFRRSSVLGRQWVDLVEFSA